MKARDIMTRDPLTVHPDTEIGVVTKLLLEKRINGIPVVDASGKLVGIVCQSDLISQQRKLPIPSFFTILDGFIPLMSMKSIERAVQKVAAKNVADIMTPDPMSINPETDIEIIADLMVEKKFHTLPVVDHGELVGIVGKEDVLRTLIS